MCKGVITRSCPLRSLLAHLDVIVIVNQRPEQDQIARAIGDIRIQASYDTGATGCEIYFDNDELMAIANWRAPRPVIMEPTVKERGACIGANKQWPLDRYLAVAEELSRDGEFTISIGATAEGWDKLPRVVTPTFRDALGVLSLARLYIGPEGGLHHAAAALGIPAVVIFGGFNSPKSTGYPWHSNLSVGEPCGSVDYCVHCRDALNSITVERVVEAARGELNALDARRRQRRLM
jgi:Glycosyltransferase family 9 (heptosyltransferase)